MKSSRLRDDTTNSITSPEMLLFTGVHFLGILEGDDGELSKLWLRLDSDKRHRDLFRIGDELCGKRWFPAWLMAYSSDPANGGHSADLNSALRALPYRC